MPITPIARDFGNKSAIYKSRNEVSGDTAAGIDYIHNSPNQNLSP